ncbi:integrase family protein [Pasteurellaceae bacterium 20609_3]|nr:integrase family protein [Spirabiliibacterium mucosae]
MNQWGCYFFFRYQFQGKRKKFTIGKYPATTLQNARSRVLELSADVANGVDPAAEIIRRETTFAMAYADYRGSREAEHVAGQTAIRCHAQTILDTPIAEVTRADVVALATRCAKTSPSIVAPLLSEIKATFRRSFRLGIIDNDPMTGLMASDFTTIRCVRHQTFTDEQLVIFLRALSKSKSYPYAMAAILTGCRPKELLTMERADLDPVNMLWSIPKEKHKTGRKTGAALVRAVPGPIFELLTSLADRNPPPGTLLAAGSVLRTVNRRTGGALDGLVFYDLRRTARTRWSEITSPVVAEKMLGHTLRGVMSVYDRHTYYEEMREAYARWYEYVKRLEGEALGRTLQ